MAALFDHALWIVWRGFPFVFLFSLFFVDHISIIRPQGIKVWPAHEEKDLEHEECDCYAGVRRMVGKHVHEGTESLFFL